MTLQQFSTMDIVSQAETIWGNGVLIGERGNRSYTSYLFQIDGFYVEMCINYKKGGMVSYRSFCTTALLDPYLESVDISGLFP